MFEDFSTIKLRDCNKCIHHISGNCTQWECVFETLEEHDKKVREEAIEDVLNKIDEGFCFECEHSCENCHRVCGQEGYEKETLIRWLKEKKNG